MINSLCSKSIGIAALVLGMGLQGLRGDHPLTSVWDFSSEKTRETSLPPGTKAGEKEGRKGALLTKEAGTWQLEFSTKGWPRQNALVAFVEIFDELDPKKSSTPLAGRRSWNRHGSVQLLGKLGGNQSRPEGLWISGRPDSPEAFRRGQWREYVAVIFPRSRPVDKAVLMIDWKGVARNPDSPFLIGSVRVESLPPERLQALEQWDEEIRQGYLVQLERTLEAGRLQERANQVSRALYYAGKGGPDPLDRLAPGKLVAAVGKLPGVLQEWEMARDALYWQGRLAVLQGNQPKVESLRERERSVAHAAAQLLEQGEEELTKNPAGMTMEELTTHRVPEVLRNLPESPAWTATPGYFRDRIRFLCAGVPETARPGTSRRMMELLGMDTAFLFRGGMMGRSWSPEADDTDTRDPNDPLVERMAALEQPGEGVEDPWKEDIALNRKFLSTMKENEGLEVAFGAMFLHNVKMLGGQLPPALTDLENTFARPYGQTHEAQDSGALNLWSDQVRRYVVGQTRAFGRLAAQSRGHMAAFNTFNEMRWDRPVFVAYNPEAQEAFRTFLRERVGTLEKLNALLRTSYESWGEVQAPAPPERHSYDPQPLEFLWMEFRAKCFEEYGQLVFSEFKKQAPETPVWYETLSWIPDIAHVHTRAERFANLRNYNIRRLYGKTIADSETGTGGYPEHEWDSTAEQVAAASERDLMDALMMSQRGLTFWHRFFTANSTGHYAAFHNDPDGNQVIAPRNLMRAAVLRDKADRYGELFLKAAVDGDGVGVVYPGSAMDFVYPPRGDESKGLMGAYLRHGYQPFFTNADDFSRDRDNFDHYRVLVFINSPYAPEGLPEKLLPWIREGGIAFFSGLWGLATPLGESQTQIQAEAFGTPLLAFPPTDPAERAAIEDGGRWDWRYHLAALAENPKAEVLLRDADGRPQIVSIGCGQGRVVVQSQADPSGEAHEVFLKILEKIHPPRVRSDASVRLIPLTTEDDRHFLGVINTSSTDSVLAELAFRKPWKKAVDLGVGHGVDIPVTKSENGEVSLKLPLSPGESTVVELRVDGPT